jgi:transcriptional regulator
LWEIGDVYAPAPFDQHDSVAMIALMRARPFAHVVVNGADGPVAAHTPLAVVTDEAGAVIELVGHVARANPFWQAAQDAGRALALFMGPDAYVSASLYPSKAEHGKVVPTWNYIAVEARGAVAIETDPENMLRYVETATALMETGREPQWRVSDAPETYVRSMLRGIVGLRIAVEALEGKWKLSQNKGEADFEGVHAALAASDFEDDRAIAAAMRKTRPT